MCIQICIDFGVGIILYGFTTFFIHIFIFLNKASDILDSRKLLLKKKMLKKGLDIIVGVLLLYFVYRRVS